MADKNMNDLTIKDFVEYVNTNTQELITKAVFSPMSTTLFRIQTGCNAPTALNLLDTSVVFGDGDVCGFSKHTQQTISQRKLVPGFVKVYTEYCEKVFLNSWMNHEINMAAGREKMPFMETLVADIVKNTGKNLEIAIWQGDVDSADDNLNKFDGLLKIMFASVPEANKIAIPASGKMIDRVWSVYEAIPEEKLFDTVIYMNNANFRTLIHELVEKNWFHYERNVDESMDIILPGTTTHVKVVNGLTGVDVIVACDPNHVVYGCDMQNDAETVHAWYDENTELFKMKISFAAGTQIALPNEVILSGEYTPGSGSGSN